jgi:hypothetical protein
MNTEKLSVRDVHARLNAIAADINAMRRRRWELEYPVGHADRDLVRPKDLVLVGAFGSREPGIPESTRCSSGFPAGVAGESP